MKNLVSCMVLIVFGFSMGWLFAHLGMPEVRLEESGLSGWNCRCGLEETSETP